MLKWSRGQNGEHLSYWSSKPVTFVWASEEWHLNHICFKGKLSSFDLAHVFSSVTFGSISLHLFCLPKFINTRFCNFEILLQSRLRGRRRGCKFVPLCIPRQKRITQTHLKAVQSMFYHHSTFWKARRKSTLYKYRLQDKKDHHVQQPWQ